jgi:ABC-type dipeptide/oligopeptide/nickel transport system permease subunit
LSQTTAPDTLGSIADETPVDPNSSIAKEISGKSPMQIAWGRLRRDKIALVCMAVVLFFVLVAVFAPLITKAFGVSTGVVFPSQYLDFTTGMPKDGPPLNGFDPDHPFGIAPKTADDNLAQWVYGCRTSLVIAGAGTLIASTIGIVMGLLSGFMGGMVDRVLSFFIDAFLTVPFLLAALTIAPIISERFNTYDNYATIQKFSIIGVLAMFGWMGLARLIRGEVLSLREREFVQAARVMGMPTRRILVRELLPNLAAPIIIAISLMLPAFVALEAGLAFLGVGVTSGSSWGRTIEQATVYFESYPLFLWEPMLGIIALVLSLNLLGDALRDALDPKTRR